MKSWRLKNKERYTKSILSNTKSVTVARTQNPNPQQFNVTGFIKPISSLGLQSQLNSLKQKKIQQDSF